MTDFNDLHSPTPDFQASLKRELLRAHRTESQFAPPRSSRARRIVVVSALVFAAALTLSIGLVLGASTGFASAEVLDARKRETTLATMATARQLAALRLELAQTYYEAVQREVAAGSATPAALRLAREEVDSMQAYVARVDVDVAASRATPPPPRPRLAILRELPMRRALTALACAAVAAAPVPAQSSAQQGIPVVDVSAPTAKTSVTLGTVLGVHELSGGRLLVNDGGRRQIVIFDAGLSTATVALDSVLGTSHSYFSNAGKITRWLGDSTIFATNGGRSTLVLDGNGQIARAVAPPPMGVGNGNSVAFPAPDAVDVKGRFYARGPTQMVMRPGDKFAHSADSINILRADLDSRAVDIVGAIRATGMGNRGDPPINGRRVVTTIIQPVPTEDAWTVLSDGTLAIVRGQDYHVDWLLPDGTRTSTAKLPFDWKHLSDADKQKMVDSARVVWDSLMLVRNRRVGAVDASGNVLPAGDNVGAASGNAGGSVGRQGGGGPPPNNDAGYQRMEFVPLSEIPDFYPPVHANAAIADLDGNLWILPTTSAQSQHGELIYDVVNPKRGLFERVRMPVGRSIVGFGPGGIVYLQSGDRTNGFYLERVKVNTR